MKKIAWLLLLLVALTSCERDVTVVLTKEQWDVIKANVLKEEPKVKHKVGANLDNKILLIGYDLDKEVVKPGESFTITCYWKCLDEMTEDWMIFVHIDSYMGHQYRLNLDHHPVQNLYNSKRWKKGEIIRDVQKARFPADFPGGDATIWIGAWRGEFRLRVLEGVATDGSDRIKMGVVTVKGKAGAGLPRLKAFKATGEIKVDGVLDEVDWVKTRLSGKFRQSGGAGFPARETRVRLLWDEKNLYLGFDAKDKDIKSTFDKDDANLWEQDVVEVFLDPDGDGKTYYELQVSPANKVFDAYFPTYRSDLEEARKFKAKMRTAVKVDGTLNNNDDEDKGYTVEMAIPIDSLEHLPGKPPKVGDVWRMNMFRFDFPKQGPALACAWSPPIVGDFHTLHKFGFVTLAGSKGEGGPKEKKGAVEPKKEGAGEQKSPKEPAKEPAKDEKAGK